MIYSYGVTQQGHYHIKNNIVCQDAHSICKVSDDLCFAAVADGLGSELYTDVASKIASSSVTEYCKEHITIDSPEETILSEIKAAFDYALNSVLAEAKKNGHDENQYDTTLSLIVYIKDKIYFGQSGDSGIVALKKNGEYVAITEQQRDENGCVFPLCFKDKWVFGKSDDVASVLLATDGMLETLFTSLLFGEEINIYVVLAQYLMDNSSLGFAEGNEKEVQEKISRFVANIGEAQVNDDKKIVCVLNTSVETSRKEDDYYKVPDWVALKKKKDEVFRRLAYPHLYKENTEDNNPTNSTKEDDNTN